MKNLHLKNLKEEQILKHPYFKNFSEGQLNELKLGMQNKINYLEYAKIDISSLDIAKKRENLEQEKYGEVKKRTSTTQILNYLIDELNKQSQDVENLKIRSQNTIEQLKKTIKIKL